MLLITRLSQKVYFVVAVTITIMQISRNSTNQITLLVCQAPLIVDTSSSNVRVAIESTTGHHEACNQNVSPPLSERTLEGIPYCSTADRKLSRTVWALLLVAAVR